MVEGRDDIARVDATGVARPVGETARVRLQGRQGEYHVLPSPPHVLLLRREGGDGVDARACVLSGEIRTPGVVCDVASFVGHTGRKGELLVIDRTASRSVYFDEGCVVGAHSSSPSERLGEGLVRLGVLDEAKLAACREAAASEPLRIGEAAVRLGFVTRDRLFALMATHAQEIFHAAIVVGEGAFYFLDSFDEARLASRHRLSVSTLVRDGVRRIHEARFFQTRIPSARHVPVPAPRAAAPEAELRPVLAAIDGARSIADLGRLLSLSEFEATRAVFQLLQSGHVTIEAPRLGTKEAVTVYNDAVALLLRELDAIDEGDVVREQLASRLTTTPLAEWLAGAGPTDDGRFDADRVAATVASRPDARAIEEALGGWLHEHASYALFLARPHLQRALDASRRGGPPPQRVSQTVSGILEPIAPGPASGTAGGRTP
jgi:hypothetical protein